MSYQPPFPPDGQRPRSTPIPGDTSQDGPPTPSEFLGTSVPTDTPPPIRLRRTRRRGNAKFLAPVVIAIGVAVLGIAVAVWGINQARTKGRAAITTANEYSDPRLSDRDRASLGLTGDEQYLWQGEAMVTVTSVFDDLLPGQPTQYTELDFFTDFAIATAQNPAKPDHLDSYTWRMGHITGPEPEQNDADAPSKVFTAADVDWAAISAVADTAASVLQVEQGAVAYVLVSRDSFTEGAPVIVRIYVTGPRGSRYMEVAADGTVLRTF